MSLLGVLVLLLIAAIIGSVGQALAGYSRGGCVVSIVVGIVGAFLGNWLAGALGLPIIVAINIQGQVIPLIWSIVGAALFVAALGLITGRR